MREFFIDTPLDWVELQYEMYNGLPDATKSFGEEHIRISARMGLAYQDCFADYLLFEHKPIFFYFKTGLEYFVENNPLGLDSSLMKEYKEILETNTAAIFEVKRVVEGLGMEIYNLEIGDVFVHASLDEKYDYEAGMFVWARIAKVGDTWHFINDFTPPLSLASNTDKTKILTDMTVQEVAMTLFLDREKIIGDFKNKKSDSK